MGMRVLLVCFMPVETELGGQQTYVHAVSHGFADLGIDVSVLGLRECRRNMPKIYDYDRRKVHCYAAGSYTGNYLRDLLALPKFVMAYLCLARRSDIVQANGLIDRFLAKCLSWLTRRQKLVYRIDGDVEKTIRYQRIRQPFLGALLLTVWRIEMWRPPYVVAKPSLAKQKGWIGLHVPISSR